MLIRKIDVVQVIKKRMLGYLGNSFSGKFFIFLTMILDSLGAENLNILQKTFLKSMKHWCSLLVKFTCRIFKNIQMSGPQL